mmetsp:Transcript_20435/g.37245  ORF Transcript_20435/g.37245 Transcript_20435/m.37245 type:complete len:95 (-) Transcript_20435:133-417(-)
MQQISSSAASGSSAPSRDRKNLVLRYNSFLNVLECSLRSDEVRPETLASQYQDLLTFVKGLSEEERLLIQQEDKDWSADRRRQLQEKCKDRGLC